MVLEDRRFFGHNGLDLISVVREFFKFLTLKKFGGASTVDMQFVRTVTGRYERTLYRKIREIILSRLLRYHAKKVVILRSYLDIAYFGTDIKGADEAAYAIFGCSSYRIKGENAAILASVLLSPKPRVPDDNWNRRVGERAAYALKVGATLEERFKKIGIR